MISVDIFSDVVCPWCAIGKARFERALDDFPHADAVQVRWRSFELDPHAPAERTGDYVGLLSRKYGTSPAQAQQMVDQMTARAADEGLEFRFDIVRPGNTFDAHRLLHLAADRGLQHQLKDRLLRAYHSEGEAIGLSDVLQRLATEVGLDDVVVKDLLAGDAYADAVRADEEQARDLGISGVPFFVIDGKVGLSGAQPPETILAGLNKALSLSDAHTSDEACAADGCCI